MEVDSSDDDYDGSILSIHVRNFFCHDNLEVKLNRNVNFIVGQNGSGKSAILTALVIGLGSRASATNRGNNLHSFIKKGTNSATVEIKIKNSSEKAFKHNIYGDSITIVRNINASGSTAYKVKSATGEVISTKLDEVNSIILAHDIQVDNPISVLNQDDARSFHASDAKKKYLLFRKATNLDQTESNYCRALENCNKSTVIWDKKNEALQELEKEVKKWKSSHEQLQSRDEIQSKKQALQNEYYWSEISELENEASVIQIQYDKLKNRIDKLIKKLNEMNDNYGSSNGVIDALISKLDEYNLEKTALEQELRDLETEVRNVQSSYRTVQNAYHKQNELHNREKRKVADLEREIKSINSGDTATRRSELEARAALATEAALASQARYSTAQNDATQARANAAHASTQAEQAQMRASNQNSKLKQLKQQLRELQSRGNNSLAVYGSKMVELCDKVQIAANKGQFSTAPRGPIGAYLKLKEKKWGGALEHILGGSIQSFCVNTPEDSRTLFEIMGRVYGSSSKPAVTCSKFLSKKHDVHRNKVRAGNMMCALDALEIEDPVIANYLIDNVRMESILLANTHEDAVRLSDTVENVPVNCSKIVTLDCTEYHPAPNYRSYGGSARQSRLLHLSAAERVTQVKSEIQESESTLRSLESEAEDLAGEARQAREVERRASSAVQALLADRHEKTEAERVAKAALDQHQAPQHAVLVDELNISKEKLESLAMKIKEYHKQEEEYNKNVETYDAKIKQVKSKSVKVTASCRSLQDEIEHEKLKVERGSLEKNTYEQKIKEDQIKLSKVEVILQDKMAVISKKTEEALTLCPKVDNARDKATVTEELKKTQLKLSSIRSDGLTKHEVAQKLLEVQRKYTKTKHMLSRLKTLIEEIKSTTDKHLNFCHKVQTYIARRVQFCFQSILTLRGYSGRMDIDNARGTLEILCTGRESSAKRHAASTSSLSGGERSYSTVAFIMALWECVELPFYVMDEFDVFMDNVNRKIVMELLIDHALKNTTRQFVFLTPQDTSSVSSTKQISIHRMADPRP